jgi:hypothetical protein
MKTSQQAFAAGWLHGRRHRRHQSIREVMDSHPGLTWELAAIYLNGQDDGIRGDRFRLEIGAESSLKNAPRMRWEQASARRSRNRHLFV